MRRHKTIVIMYFYFTKAKRPLNLFVNKSLKILLHIEITSFARHSQQAVLIQVNLTTVLNLPFLAHYILKGANISN